MIHEPEVLTRTQAGAVSAAVLERPPQSSGSEPDQEASLELPALVTQTASKQAYYTIRFLVDRERILAAYRAYAYFRWVDDRLDQPVSDRSERLDFMARQQALVDAARRGQLWSDLTREERLVADLIRSGDEPASGLQSYISNMMAVMAFDARRSGRRVSEHELDAYTRRLATAVTDALHYFIGHVDAHPQSDARSMRHTTTKREVSHYVR